jgi:hypothetical protein
MLSAHVKHFLLTFSSPARYAPGVRKNPFTQIRIDDALTIRLQRLADLVGYKLNHFAEAALADFADLAEAGPGERTVTKLLAMLDAAQTAKSNPRALYTGGNGGSQRRRGR